jgi:hypothetical protein
MNKEQIHIIQNLVYSNEKFIKLNDNQKQDVNNFLIKEMNTANMRYKDLLNDDTKATPIFKLILKNTYDHIGKTGNIPIDPNTYKNQKKETFNQKYNDKQHEYNSLQISSKPNEINFAIEDDPHNEDINKLLEREIENRNQIVDFISNDVDNANKLINNNKEPVKNSIDPNAKVLKIHNNEKKVRFEEVKDKETDNELFNNFLSKIHDNNNDLNNTNNTNEQIEMNINDINGNNKNININDNSHNLEFINKKLINIEESFITLKTSVKKLDENIERINNILILIQEKIM